MPTFPYRSEPNLRCPACGGHGLTTFYEVLGLPTLNNLQLATVDEALAQPTGDLRLAHCKTCGFITNTAFDPATQAPSDRYEATQGFSPTFGKFARTLAEGWIARYGLGPGKTALEIGCGVGEFVAMLCQLSGCHGIGIDPLVDPGRVPSDASQRVRYIADVYDERYATIAADFVCCRHTLEHIAHPHAFLSTVGRAMSGRFGTPVCFEVPDTLRVLREGAFWDLYYEHCSYFTPGSLARVFRATGFDVTDLRLEFDGQYIVLEAKNVMDPAPPQPGIEDDVNQILEAVTTFAAVCTRQTSRWREVVDRALDGRKRVALWGSGSKAVGFLATLGLTRDVLPYVVDINPYKHGTYLPTTAQEVVAPDKLADYRPDVVIAMNPVYRAEIRKDFDRLGLGDSELLAL